MRILIFTFQLFIALGFVTTLSGQRFQCDGQLLVATTDGESTTIYRPRSAPFVPPFFSGVMKYTGGNFDALGFNSKDNFIYAVEQNTNAIVRLKRNSSYEVVGNVGIVNTLKSNAGDCTPEGLFLCHDYELHQILVFDVVDAFALLERVDLFWDPTYENSGTFRTRLFDFAIDPNEPTVAYAYQGRAEHEDLAPAETRGFLLKINLDFNSPNLGMVTPVESVNSFSHLGAILFSSDSGLFGYGTPAAGLNPPQNTLYSISTANGKASQVLTKSPAAVLSDGCSCPFSFQFTNALPVTGMFCNNDKDNFIVTISNNSYIDLTGVTLKDTLPEGMIIDGISETFSGDIEAGTGVGTGMLIINDLLIPAKTKLVITIKVNSIDAIVGPNGNQVYLENMPFPFEGNVVSDDPFTEAPIGDPSTVFVVARELTDVTWEVIPPNDCILANDGKIVVSSPQFFLGQEFEIRLRNKKGWEETTAFVEIDQSNSFTVDSLVPGDYQVFYVRSVNENCSLALKDTTVLLEPPNDQLTLEVSSNSSICEGESLLLDSEISPEGNIRWTGPLLFGSETPDPIFENTEADRTGEYKAVAKYGFCTQTKFLDVDVKPTVNLSVAGDSVYCERDSLLLIAAGEGDSLKYSWTGPNNISQLDSMLLVPNLISEQAGYYEVIADNGACSDTAGIEVELLPTPWLSLEDIVMTDFCGTVILVPEITGDSDVSYRWLPEEGLSCSDCLTPQLQPIVNNNYQLRVQNEYLCTDSAKVNIVLDKETLVHTPNIFRPSSTVGNTHYSLFPGCVVTYIHKLSIYDRWGGRVFNDEAAGSDETIGFWDGNVKGKKVNSGVYIWIAKVELVDGSIQYLSGDVTVL